jgi:adenosylcobinamide kinase/adenosylcobinamide-phosphate guanylyltransferase
MKSKIIFVTGGARSGKSSFALNEALKIEGRKAYIATAEALDDEMKKRIEKHRKERGSDWDTYEEPLKVSAVLSKINNKYKAIVLDCLTLWLSNILLRQQNADDSRLRRPAEAGRQTIEKNIKKFVDELMSFKNSSHVTRHASRLFIVSNEVGMGIVPDNELARKFRDLAGSLNQKVAGLADEVYLVTAGIPMKIK